MGLEMQKDILRKNLDLIIEKVEKARLEVSKYQIVQIVAVAKYTDIENIELLYSLGQRAFGENHLQQLESRSKELEHLPLEWHLIGTLQKNKINKLLEVKPSLFQALDSIELARELDKKLSKHNQKLSCLLQINSSYESTKSGFEPDGAIDAYMQIKQECPNINLKGVMTIGANSSDIRVVKDSFEKSYKIYEKLQKDGATICSMGMSSDFELGIKCGSNMVRVGSLIFDR